MTKDFNTVNLAVNVSPEGKTLDYFYSPFKKDNMADSLPLFHKSDQAAIFLIWNMSKGWFRELLR